MRRVLMVVAAVVIAAAGCVALIAVLTSQDSSQVSGASGPGTLEPDRGSGHQTGPATPASPANRPPTSGRHRKQDVTRDQTELTDDQILEVLQRDVNGGAFDPFLAGAGQAVILARRPGAGVQALAWRRRLVASGPEDPKLRDFADAWLGQGPGSG